MVEEFKDAFSRFKFIGLKDLLKLFPICSFKNYKKNELLAEEGKYCPNAYLILKGVVRTFVLTDDGDERTIRLASEKDFTSSGQSFLNGLPSNEYLQCVEDCRVIAINTKKLEELAKDNIGILRLSHEGLKEAFSEAIDRIEFFTTLNPEQRYHRLLEQTPNLIQRIPQKYLASYLGITTVSLSRIRNR